jgi:hypothetical protein
VEITPADRAPLLAARREDGEARSRPENVVARADGEENPYRILGALLIVELSAPPPRFSLRRKRLRAAMRARLAEAFLAERHRLREEGDGPAAA